MYKKIADDKDTIKKIEDILDNKPAALVSSRFSCRRGEGVADKTQEGYGRRDASGNLT
jgi:hypothetical protein